MALLSRGTKSANAFNKRPRGRQSARLFPPRNGHLLSRKLFFLIGIIVWSAVARAAEHPPATEYQVKAAFLYNFAKFIEWPAQAFRKSDTPLTLCVLGKDPFGSDLEETIVGKTVNERRIMAKQLKRAENLEACHILFISSSEQRQVPQILGALNNSPVLTVSEVEKFAKLGGVINFITEDNKIRFEINVVAAKRAGLKISSSLLKLARIVEG